MNYTFSMHLLGLPLVHVAIGLSEGSSAVRGIAKGWIAVGDIAIAVIFAFGGGAIAVRAANGGLALA